MMAASHFVATTSSLPIKKGCFVTYEKLFCRQLKVIAAIITRYVALGIRTFSQRTYSQYLQGGNLQFSQHSFLNLTSTCMLLYF